MAIQLSYFHKLHSKLQKINDILVHSNFSSMQAYENLKKVKLDRDKNPFIIFFLRRILFYNAIGRD